MRLLILPLICFNLAGCDRISQRVWNCSAKSLDVLKTNAPDFEIVETIPSRSWISSMKGGVQITAISVADGTRSKVLWHQGQPVLTVPFDSPEKVCAGRTEGIVVQQF
jgi:hypothetical protein